MDAQAQTEFGVHPAGAAGGGVDAHDGLGQPGVLDQAVRQRTVPPGVVPGLGNMQHPSGQLHWPVLTGHHADGFEPPFGDVTSPSSSAARRWMANSGSSSAIRLRAVASSDKSLVRAGQLTCVDEVLATPDVDRLVADAEEPGDLGDFPSGRDEIEDLAAEFGRIAAGHHGLRRLLDGQLSNNPTPSEPGRTKISTEPGAVHSAVSKASEAES